MKRANSAPESGFYREIINTDAETYGGSNVGNFGGVQTQDVPWMGRQFDPDPFAAAVHRGIQVRKVIPFPSRNLDDLVSIVRADPISLFRPRFAQRDLLSN